MNLRQLTIIAIVFVGIATGIYFSTHSWGGQVYFTRATYTLRRDPAAIQRGYDFSHLDGHALTLASQKRLVSNARVLTESGMIGIELGHFVTRGVSDEKQLACDFYDRIDLIFKAEGMAESGERAIMVVSGPCETGNDINYIAPIWIPAAYLTQGPPPPSDSVLDFPDLGDTSIHFDNITSEWPPQWVLTSVRLFGEYSVDRELAIDESEMGEILDRPLIIAWP
jgi:hypothetical protein